MSRIHLTIQSLIYFMMFWRSFYVTQRIVISVRALEMRIKCLPHSKENVECQRCGLTWAISRVTPIDPAEGDV